MEPESDRPPAEHPAAQPAAVGDWLRMIFDHAALGIAVVDLSGRLTETNPALQRMIGYSADELRGMTLERLTHPDDLHSARDRLRELLRAERTDYQVENRYLRPDGAVVWGSLAVSVLRRADGQATHALAMIQDITERKRIEASLEASETKFRALIENAADLVSVLDADGTIRYESPSIERILGYRPDELVGRSVFELIHPEDRDHVGVTFAQILSRPEEPIGYTLRYLHSDGSYRSLEGIGTNLLGDPAIGGVVANSRDVTERELAQRALERERALFEQLFESSPEGIVIVDPHDRVIQINSEFSRLFGFSAEEVVGRTLSEFLIPEGREAEAIGITQRIAGGARVQVETTRRRGDGSAVEVAVQGVPISVGESQIAVFGIYQDISARKASQRALQESEERFRTVVDVLGEGITLTDLAERILYVNARMAEITGYSKEELIGQVASELLLPPEEQARMLERHRQRAEGHAGRYEMQQYRKDGSLIWVEVSGSPLHDASGRVIGTVGATTDITDRKELEQALRRMSTTDVLTGLLNRRGFMEVAEREWSLARRRGQGHLLLYVDLDEFKPINDGYGHAEGDRLLQDVAQLLRHCFRATDVLARIGGDEFVVLAIDADAESVSSLHARIDDAVDRFNESSQRPYRLRMSVGVHHSPAGAASTLDSLLAEADRQMYRRKQSRR